MTMDMLLKWVPRPEYPNNPNKQCAGLLGLYINLSVHTPRDRPKKDVWLYTNARHTGIDPAALGDKPDGWYTDVASAKQAAQDYADKLMSVVAAAMNKSPMFTHVKRGTTYTLIGYGRMQSEHWVEPALTDKGTGLAIEDNPVDMRQVAIYQSRADGSLWVRPLEEFEDGRFVPFTGTVDERIPANV